MGISITNTAKNITTTSVNVLAENEWRRFLSVQNKHATQTIRVKFKSANGVETTEIQTITPSLAPNAGTFKIRWDGNDTTALDYNASAATIQTALRLLSGLGSVTVSGTMATAVVVTMTGVTYGEDADLPLLQIVDENLTVALVPEVQDVTFDNAPNSGTFKLNYNASPTAAINYNDSSGTVQTKLRAISGLEAVTVSGSIASGTLTVTFVGVDANVALLTVSDNSLQIDAVTEVQTVTFSAVPQAGAWKLTHNANETGSLAYNDNAAAVQTALRLLPTLGSVTVTGDYSGGFVVTFAGVSGNASALSVTSNTLVIPDATEVQNLAFAPTPVSGSFKLNYDGNPTSSLNYDVDAATMQTALRLLPGLGSVTVSGSIAASFDVTFTGVIGNALMLTSSDNTLQDGGANPTVITITETTPGTTTAVTGNVAETTPGSIADPTGVTVTEITPGDPHDEITVTVAETTKGVFADGHVLAAGASLQWSGDACPTDAVYAVASGANTRLEILEGA